MSRTFDTSWIRSQYPIFDPRTGRPPELFFDGPGGTQVPRQVVEAVSGYLVGCNANLHGAFHSSRESDAIVAEAHRAAGDLLGCSAREVIFGSNMTTLTFWLSRALESEFGPGDEIVVTRLDHDANYAPWKSLEPTGVTLREVRFKPKDCTLDLSALRSAINRRTKFVAVGYASNAVGTINDVKTVVRLAHAVGARVFVDAVHYAPHAPIDVKSLDCDFLACSAYKFFGPHQGLLYGKQEHLEGLRAYRVRPADDDLPGRLETGTQNHEGMAGTAAAIQYIAGIGRRFGGVDPNCSRREAVMAGMTAIRNYERGLAQRLIRGLLEVHDLEFYGIRDEARFDWRVPTAAFRLRGIHPRAISEALARRRICVWDGNFYAVNVTEDLGLEDTGGLVRVGLTHYNTSEEVDQLLDALQNLRR